MNDLFKPHQCPRCFGLFNVGDRFWNDSGTVYHWLCWVNKPKEKFRPSDLEELGLTAGEIAKMIKGTSMTKDKALKLALEALEEYHYGEARIILRQALEQPEERPWVGLTDDEKIFFSTWLDYKEDHEVFTAIEAKLKEKNT
jgi:hypothetical protein